MLSLELLLVCCCRFGTGDHEQQHNDGVSSCVPLLLAQPGALY